MVVQGALTDSQAKASPAAKLPLEVVIMPFAFSSSVKAKARANAPRTLKAPVFWKFSHLQNTAQPNS